MTGLLAPLRQRDFRLLFTGETISLIGDHFHFVALAWLTLQLTGSGLALGTVLMVAAIPRAVFMLLGGALSDRFSPRTLMLVSNAARAVVVGILAVLVLSGSAQLWQLYVVAAVFGVVDALFYPAIGTILPMLVSERLLAPANALMQGAQQLSGLLGPAAAGLLVAAVQTGPAFAIDAVSFAIATLTLFFVAGGRRATTATADGAAEAGAAAGAEGLLGTIGTGLRYVWRDPAIRSLMIIIAAFNLAISGPINVGLPYLASTRFEGGSAAFGFLISAFGLGALGGALAAGTLQSVPRLGTLLLGIGLLLGVGVGLIGLAANLWYGIALMLPIGMGAGFVNVHLMAWLQSRTAEAMRGRVMSLTMLSAVGLAPVSYAVSGIIVDLGQATLMFLAAGALVAAAVLSGFATGTHRRIDEAGPLAPAGETA